MNDEFLTSDAVSLEVALNLGKVCDRFEDAWLAGQSPRIEEYLSDAPPDRGVLLAELLHLDLHYRGRRGEEPAADEYRQRFPADAEVIDAVFASAGATVVFATGPSAGPPEAELRFRIGPSVQQDATETLPVQIGKYRVIERLGRGTQGEVFRAVHPQLGRDVVVKWSRDCLPDGLRERLLDEGRVLANLDDPGLVRIHDVDLHEGRPFLVMEYVAGRSLADQLKGPPFSFRAALRLTVEAAHILSRLHRQGVCQRNLKPANILIDGTGRVRLIDFGLASLCGTWRTIHPPDADVCGTLNYMAPEQARSDGAAVGPRSDVFSLGGVLFHMLTGRPPYQGTSPTAVWEQAKRGHMVHPRSSIRAFRARWSICLKALSHDPEQRYPSADALERDLRRYLRRPLLASDC